MPTTTAAPPDAMATRYLRPHELTPWPGLNPREHFDEARILELAFSIAEHGVLQNLIVHDTGESPLYVVAGESRLRAAKLAEEGSPEHGLEPAAPILIPCRVREFEEGAALKIATVENVQRASLTAVEEAKAFKRLLELNNWTQARLAEEILGDAGKQSYVANRLRLLDLPADILVHIQSGHLKASHARDYLLPLLKLDDEMPRIAFDRMSLAIQGKVDEGEEIRGGWVQEIAETVRAAVLDSFGNKNLFGDDAAAPAKEQEAMDTQSPAATVEDSGPPPSREGQYDYLLRHALTRGGLKWAAAAETGATDGDLKDAISRAFAAVEDGTVQIKSVGSYRAESGAIPRLTLMPLSRSNSEVLGGSKLISEVRRLFGISEPIANPKPAAKPAPPPKPAPAPEPVVASAPVTTLASPDAARGEIPEGAGLITAVTTATGGRPVVITVTPIADGRIALTVAPKILKAGETPFARTGSAEQLDAELVAALDTHFSK